MQTDGRLQLFWAVREVDSLRPVLVFLHSIRVLKRPMSLVAAVMTLPTLGEIKVLIEPQKGVWPGLISSNPPATSISHTSGGDGIPIRKWDFVCPPPQKKSTKIPSKFSWSDQHPVEKWNPIPQQRVTRLVTNMRQRRQGAYGSSTCYFFIGISRSGGSGASHTLSCVVHSLQVLPCCKGDLSGNLSCLDKGDLSGTSSVSAEPFINPYS